MYGNEKLGKYGQFRYATNDVFEGNDNVQLRFIMENCYNHKDTTGLEYEKCIEGILRNQVINRIVRRVM